MKKIISLGIASAVLALTAISASAGVVVNTDPAKVNPGAEITVEFKLDADTSGFQFDIAPVGLTLVEGSSKTGTASIPNAAGIDMTTCNGTRFLTTSGFKAGEVILTQTYKVTAAEGEAVAINITNADNVSGTSTNLTATVVAGSGDTSKPDDSKPDDSKPDDSKPDDSKPDDSKPNGGDNDNPNSGVALAVFPAIIAGAAVVVAKKRK